MKQPFIIFSLLVVGVLAFSDAKARLEELENVAATTPSQVEMKREIPQSTGSGIMQKTDNSSSQLAFPESKQNNSQVQNLPQKLNPKFLDLPKQNQTNQSP